MSDTPTKTKARINCWVDASLHGYLQARATADRRSVANMLEVILEADRAKNEGVADA
ncbi:MAG: hypothetical protein OXC11_02335 [Rhodospirillales bacterium]|nr:hypothetical protein [Rhodospirillales bacterium]